MKQALFVCNMDSFHHNFNQPYAHRLNEHEYVVDLEWFKVEMFEIISKEF